MIVKRTIEDFLREEYFNLLPEINKVTKYLETYIKFILKDLIKCLESYQRIEIVSRVKNCESAIKSLQRRQQGNKFDQNREYTLQDLKDLSGVRILFFPSDLCEKILCLLKKQKQFKKWKYDPICRPYDSERIIAEKYYGYVDSKINIYSEFQVVPMLIGRFWDIEHFSFYKPSPDYWAVQYSPDMRIEVEKVYNVLEGYEIKFKNTLEEWLKETEKNKK